MHLLEAAYMDGRDRAESKIVLTAHWLSGWKRKDNKWKFEEETRLPHLGGAFFRCRVHLFAEPNTSGETIAPFMDEIDSGVYDLEGVFFSVHNDLMTVLVPLNLHWSVTDNISRNPCLSRTTGQYGLPVKPLRDLFTLHLLITYRNLDRLLRSQRYFVQRNGGFGWKGRVTENPQSQSGN